MTPDIDVQIGEKQIRIDLDLIEWVIVLIGVILISIIIYR